MAQSPSSGFERLRQRIGDLPEGPPSAATRQLVENHVRTERQKIDELALQGKFDEALLLEAENNEDLIDLYGKENLRTIQSFENISSFSFSCGSEMNVETILSHVIDLRTKVQGEKHPDTLGSIASKVEVLHATGRIQEAERLGLECVEKCKEYLKPDDRATLRAMSNLASIYTSKGDLDTSEKLCREVLEIQQRALPYDDIETVKSMVNLSDVYCSQKRWTHASSLLESALNVRRRTFGDGHQLTVFVAGQLQDVYTQLGSWKDIQPVQLLILEATRKHFGDEHDETVAIMTKLSATYIRLEAWSEAAEMMRKVRDIRKKKFPFDHPTISRIESYLEAISSKAPGQECPEPGGPSLIYNPLKTEGHEIRLVYLMKSAPGDELHARLLTVSLDNAPPFEAFSYVWGNQQNPGSLNLDGHLLDITNNLEAALLQLRSETHDRLLWVDAICINQADLKERSEQVYLMRDIYIKATRTIVWLGKAEANSDLAMKFLGELGAHPSPEDFVLRTLRTRQDNALYDSINSLFKQKAYWRRLWIVQEVICATDVVVHCGKHSVSYATMQSILGLFGTAYLKLDDYALMTRYEKFVTNLSFTGPTHIKKSLHSEGQQSRPLLELLYLHRTALCTDPRDRIYALIGISSLRSSTHPGLKIDYANSTSEVYRGAAEAIIEETACLDIICMNSEAITRPDTNQYRARQPFLPTWAPDWNVYQSSMTLSTMYPSTRACGDSRARFKFSNDGNVLTAEGLDIAPLHFCSERFELTTTRYKDMIRLLLSWRLMTQAHLGIPPFQQADPRLDQFYKLITCENTQFDGILLHTKTWWNKWQSEWLQQKSVEAIEVLDYQKGYLQFIFDFCVGKRLLYFESPKGRLPPSFKLGMCPREAKKGDSLVVLLGCRSPVILHPTGNHYVLIGEALVPEYMRGKAVEEMRDGTSQLRSFEIH